MFYACSDTPAFHSLYFADSGLMIFSRFPITKSDFHMFSYGHGGDAEVSRGVLFAEI